MKSHSGPAARARRLAYGAGLLAAGTVVGGVLAGTVSASASTTATSASTGTSTAAAQPSTASGPGTGGAAPSRSSTPVRRDEKAVSTADLVILKAEALKAVPGGTVYRVETDAGDGTYEAHMTKADGSLVTVKFDKNLAVTKVEQGMGQGDPALGAPAGAPGGVGSA